MVSFKKLTLQSFLPKQSESLSEVQNVLKRCCGRHVQSYFHLDWGLALDITSIQELAKVRLVLDFHMGLVQFCSIVLTFNCSSV